MGMFDFLKGNREPQTRVGRFIDVGGQFATNALIPGPKGAGALATVGAKTAYVAVPTITSEGAGQIVEENGGTPGQAAAARFVGALGGGAGKGVIANTRVVSNLANTATQVPTRIGSGFNEAGARISQMAGHEPGPVTITPADTTQALRTVESLARRTGVTPDDLANNPVSLAGKPITSAEAMGRPAMGQLTALGRRSGSTPDQLEALITARMEAAPGRMADDVADVTGLDPNFVAGDLEAAAGKMRLQAQPLYDAAYEVTPQSSRLEALMQRPSVQDAMRRGARIAREEGQDPSALGLWDMETPPPATYGSSPMPAAADIGAVRGGMKDAGRAERRALGPSLLEFIAKRGGMNEMGELGAMDAQTFHRARPFMEKLIKETGDSADGAGLAAFEAGYFQARPTPEELFEAIRGELAGKSRYAATADEATQRMQGLQSLDEELGRAGVNLHGKSNAEAASDLGNYRGEMEGLEYLADGGGSLRPEYGPVTGETPSMRALDYVKRGLDDRMTEYRNPITRQLELNTEGRAVSQTLNDFRDELTTLNPAYKEALRTSSEPLRLEQAFRDGPKLMSAAVNERMFTKRVAKMSDPEKQALLGGWVEGVNSSARNGRLRLRDYKNPAIRSKLAQIVGPEKAAEVMQRVEMEQTVARGNRMSPGTNAVTSEVMLAAQEMDRVPGIVGDFQRRLDTGNIATAIAGTSSQAVASPIAGFIRGVQAPYGPGVRDEIGRLLMMSPEELAEELRRMGARNITPPREPMDARTMGLLAAPGLTGAGRVPPEEEPLY